MKKITLTVSPMPPFLGINIDIPIDKIVANFQKLTEKKYEIATTLKWTFERILEDQWTQKDTDAMGAWSKRYPEYLKFYYDPKPLPSDISFKDTISFSSWIVRPMLNFLNNTNEINLKKEILHRVYFYKEYLLRHYDDSIGAFGLTRITSAGTTSLAVDIRHTAWALLSLIDINEIDNSINQEVFTDTGKYIFKKLDKNISKKERALTFAVLHQVITNEKAKSLIAFNENDRKRLQSKIENAIITRYNKYYSSWDLEIEDKNKIKIINSLFILMSMDISKIIETDLLIIVKEAIEYLESYLINIDETKAALPFIDGDKPDIGATIQFFSILTTNKEIEAEKTKVIKKFAEYIFDTKTLEDGFRFAYPFHISQILNYKQ